MGIQIEEAKNRAGGASEALCDVSVEGSPVRVLVVPTLGPFSAAKQLIAVWCVNTPPRSLP